MTNNMFAVREAEDNEINFLISTLKHQMREAFPFSALTDQEYNELLVPQLIDHVLGTNAQILVAVPIAVQNTVAGWISVDKALRSLNFVYTKSVYRRFGCAKQLLAAAELPLEGPFTYSLRPYLAQRYETSMKTKNRNIEYLPAFEVKVVKRGE